MTSDDTFTHAAVDSDRSAIETGGFDHEKARRGARLLLESMGRDPDRRDLVETWQRRVPATFHTLTEGHRSEEKPMLRTFETGTTDLIVKTGIPIYSLCKHHLLPFHGSVHVAYRPNGAVVGLSKLTRYVRWQSRRVTMQEQLTTDIADGLRKELDAPVVMIEVSAIHLCEAMRGVETETRTVTRATVGEPTEPERRRFQSGIDAWGNV